MITHSLLTLFNLDALALMIIALVGFIGITVAVFARKYLEGDTRYTRFFCLLSLLITSLTIMAAADHLLLFLLAWGISNFTLVQLMIHKPQWAAAAHSGKLAAKTFLFGYLCLAIAFFTLYLATGQTSIHSILTNSKITHLVALFSGLLIFLTAMTQSAIWPFHRWLMSSLNAPTPVSAIMHAGLVNGGGVLLARFAPLYFSQPPMLTLLFVMGISTAILASIWKLMQCDIKRMLAASTMAQMGFMIAQCGLGLFAAAIAHLCWHGLFKANLFLHAYGTKSQKNLTVTNQVTGRQFMLSLIIGVFGSYIFAKTSQQPWLTNNTSTFLMLMVTLFSTQFNLSILEHVKLKTIFTGLTMTAIFCAAYGYNVFIIDTALKSLHLIQPQPLNLIHITAMIALTSTWVITTFNNQPKLSALFSKTRSRLYVKALNASQPHPKTITTHRHNYQY
ncbi:MAG TPA: proton-conducting transporter membrane subunit [Gammaproteobacteria bacterium]|nr:proton-conducting transporter membrane subunit [Gammaproteobacteria bacterium]